MKSCLYCKKDDLHDEATRCPHCGGWQGKLRHFRFIAELIGWICLVALILGLVTCGAGLAIN